MVLLPTLPCCTGAGDSRSDELPVVRSPFRSGAPMSAEPLPPPTLGRCSQCEQTLYVWPLHIEAGGPPVCLLCGFVFGFVADLREALSPKLPRQFREHNEASRAQSEILREAIRKIDAAHQGPAPLAAKVVLECLRAMGPEELGLRKLPTLRAVQWHLKAIRASTGPKR